MYQILIRVQQKACAIPVVRYKRITPYRYVLPVGMLFVILETLFFSFSFFAGILVETGWLAA